VLLNLKVFDFVEFEMPITKELRTGSYSKPD